MEPDDLLCSRNARPPKALVGRAQWKINQPPSPEEKMSELEGSSGVLLDGRSWTTTDAIPNEERGEQAWKGHIYG